MAAKSFSSIALTCESPGKPGPLRYAVDHGGKVLDLANFATSGQSLRAYIEAFIDRFDWRTIVAREIG